MLVDIFSSFDDNNQVFMSLYFLMWGFSLLTVLLFSSSYWLTVPRYDAIIKTFKETVTSQIFRSFGFNMGGFINVVTGLFLFLIFMNLGGLIPYVFSTTSHLAVSLSLGLPLWLSLVISAIFFNPSSVVAGLLPMGAPAPLNPFLVIIETVSILVRPITLSVRLTANMSAGHIVLTLIGNYLTASFFMSSMFSMLLLISIQVLYTIFEFGISLIQAYIFCLLITLYSDEHPH
uniref:ATP synthase subunit a n=1 Tax=Potamopyrgus antipodarum TaxID=145637 RepID=D3JAT6_POTAT|nr:ATP synthase F0 subunit 6 [Potamopyrgus antipodarum]ADB93423.1 ATP synthase F0 subunit 6 [Potamopyrgus antipodarum]ADB93449.1 ATP synthase F0 subunit 6 [Potamopyrgus antipodarum]ADB93579.1 ATP synthase F0 subunit 6 [Potamopyrgus antipodarum]AVN97734.1 ATP synthase F0 subunit 6 [Potamopyrgus antipodarum]